MNTGYELSRKWFDFCFENPEKISPNHSAIFFFAIEHCNRLGWKNKFGFPTQMTMDAIGIKKHQTYIKYFNELCEWGFITLIQKSLNQYSANIISLSLGYTKNGKALDKAFINHSAKNNQNSYAENGQSNGQSIGQSKGQSNSSINKQYNKEQVNKDFSHMWTEIKKSFLQAEEWQMRFMTEKRISFEVLNKNIKDFIVERELKEDYKELPELKNHFTNWYNQKVNKGFKVDYKKSNDGPPLKRAADV